MLDKRLSNLLIEPKARYGTSYQADNEEFCLPCEEVEEYIVSYDGALVATFWVCNTYKNSILLHSPVDVDVLEYILKQMKIREFSSKNT